MITLSSFKGMDNRHKSHSLLEGFVRNLVNVDVDDTGKLVIRAGSTLLYAGDVHSYFNGYFVEGGDLKLLDSDNTATVIEAGVGDTTMAYTVVGDTVYFSNDIITGKIRGEDVTRWGVQRPPVQPMATTVTTGGLFAGDYQYAITWLDYDGEESGTIQSGNVTVAEGGGIQLTKFVTPPVNIEGIAVYVSQANSETLYLYKEYPRSIANVTVIKGLSDIPLLTQFCDVPKPSKIIQAHYGRIYLAKGSVVHYTEPQHYGLIKPNNYWSFDSDIQIIASVPGALYVATKNKTYRVGNIDAEGFPIRAEVKPYGGVIGTLSYDETSETAFWLSDKGIVAANSESITELHYQNMASSDFEQGTTTVIEQNGIKKVVGSFQVGNASSLIDSEFKQNEITRKGNAI